MNCADFEVRLADYCDDTLLPVDRLELEAHAASCAGCGEFMRDVLNGFRAGKLLLDAAPKVQPPPELITRLAQQAPLGKVRRPADHPSWTGRLIEGWLQPLLQPRWAMGMAMTILSFGMLERCTGLPVQHVGPSDLNPVRVWNGFENRAVRLKDRSVKYYENIRLVYEVEVRLHQLETEQGERQRSGNGTKLPSKQQGETKR